jgi:3'-phosphoadenosine 5'-phosphosulfate sulfotransferase (PAPS reductase)/FAD synthetase
MAGKPEINQIVSLSGGKDSTAMLLMMIERKEPIHSAIFCDTGWEFPELLEHIKLLQKNTKVNIVTVKPKMPFDYWMVERPLNNRKGYSWPSPIRRWCTREKFNAINRYMSTVKPYIQCIGYAFDEQDRTSKEIVKCRDNIRFPLIEWGITEKQALEYCYQKGYDWGGLYRHFRRVSCFCCPLQRIDGLRKLRRYYPDLWKRMLEMDEHKPNGGFKGYRTVHDLDKRFADEEKQMKLEG